jgi:hypothetical protein
VSSDLLTAGRIVPIGSFRINTTNHTLLDYVGIQGSGKANAPEIDPDGFATSKIIFSPSFTDDTGRTWEVAVRAVAATAEQSQAIAEVLDALTIRVTAHNGVAKVPRTIYVTVYGTPVEKATIDLFGGATDKQNCEAEAIPYAASWYETMQGARGSLYRQERDGLVHVENLALARHFAWQNRLAEQLVTNANPGTSGVSIPEWSERLDVQLTSDDAEMRAALAAKNSMYRGATPAILNESIARIAGPWFVDVHRNHGSLGSPPDWTYGPSWDTGPTEWDMGGGTWSSIRASLTVELVEPSGSDYEAFTEVVEKLSEHLELALPVYMTWEWATGLTTGFHLDDDSMDHVGMI